MQKECQFSVPIEGPSVSLSDQSGLESLGMMNDDPFSCYNGGGHAQRLYGAALPFLLA